MEPLRRPGWIRTSGCRNTGVHPRTSIGSRPMPRPVASSWTSAQDRLRSVPVRVKVVSAVALACVVALVVGVVSLVQLGELEQRSQEVNAEALVPASQLAAVRQAFLQTRIDALADEVLPKASAEDLEHQAYLADVQAVYDAVQVYAQGSSLSAAQQQDVATLTQAWQQYETIVGGDYLTLARTGRMVEYMA